MVKEKKKKTAKKEMKADPKDINALFNLHFKNKKRIKDIRKMMFFGVIVIGLIILIIHNFTYTDPSINATLSRWGYEEVCEFEDVERMVIIDTAIPDACNQFCMINERCEVIESWGGIDNYTIDINSVGLDNWYYCIEISEFIYDSAKDCVICLGAEEPYIHYYNETVCKHKILVNKNG